MSAELGTVKFRVSTEQAASNPEAIRRRFASAWGQMGAAWGVAPSTAAVQGYLLLHGGPLTDSELQEALGLSPRAVRIALAESQAWGVIKEAPERRRSGRRGPTGRAWLPVEEHWEWFHRVIAARKQREGDPVIAILEECLVAARADRGDPEQLRARLESLLEFVRRFDHALSALVRADTQALEKLFAVLARHDAHRLDRLLATLAALPEDELAAAVGTLSRLPPGMVRRMIRLAGQPAIGRLLGRGR
jgi:DNA-binding transcriptional regulator GbsR (MarR family)